MLALLIKLFIPIGLIYWFFKSMKRKLNSLTLQKIFESLLNQVNQENHRADGPNVIEICPNCGNVKQARHRC